MTIQESEASSHLVPPGDRRSRSGWCCSVPSMPPSPTPPAPSHGSPGWDRMRFPTSAIATAATPVVSVQNSAAQQVAEEFVEATDTTDPTHPEGDTAERAALAPALTVPRRVTWPEAWVAEDRRTTVVLDPPGPVVPVGSGQVAVVVTGRMVVTTDVGQTSEVPVDERVTLRPTGPDGSTERLPLGGHRCRVRLVKQDRVETVSG